MKIEYTGFDLQAENTVSVYNMLGKKVISKDISSLETSIDLTGVNKGVYFIKFSDGRMGVTEKLVIDWLLKFKMINLSPPGLEVV